MMIQTLAIWLIGFSLFSALLLLITHFRCAEYKGQLVSRLAGITLLVSLSGLQINHYLFLYNEISTDTLSYSPSYPILYNLCLFSVAPSFYFFSKQLLKAYNTYSHFQWLHLFPIIIALFLPFNTALPVSFIIGGGYVAWLAYTIYQLRSQRSRFKREILALGLMFVIAITVLALGLFMPLFSAPLFYAYYAINIGLAFFVTDLILLRSPTITTEVSEAAQASYIASTLENINIDKTLLSLETLMEKDKLYSHEKLHLNTLAEAVKLSPHQLSELINTRLGKGFSQYLREFRIREAKRLLIDEPKASVLSIGLEVGFTSQSNFYAAFKQIENMAPGQFRTKHLKHLKHLKLTS